MVVSETRHAALPIDQQDKAGFAGNDAKALRVFGYRKGLQTPGVRGSKRPFAATQSHCTQAGKQDHSKNCVQIAAGHTGSLSEYGRPVKSGQPLDHGARLPSPFTCRSLAEPGTLEFLTGNRLAKQKTLPVVAA
jgi:hypothetical protein